MSQVLNRLKQAEADRERLIAERRRLEAEADAALAEREREEGAVHTQAESVPPALPAAVHTRAVQEATARRSWGTFAIVAALACAFLLGTLVSRESAAPKAPAPAAPPAIAAAVPAAKAPPALFRLEQDSEAFGARAAGAERK
jgi:hypothetical protein